MFRYKLSCFPRVCPTFEKQVTSTSSQPTVKSEHWITWIWITCFSVLLLVFPSKLFASLLFNKFPFNLSFEMYFSFYFSMVCFSSMTCYYSSCRVGYHSFSQLKDLTKNQEAKEPQKLHFLIDCVFTILSSLFSFSVPSLS